MILDYAFFKWMMINEHKPSIPNNLAIEINLKKIACSKPINLDHITRKQIKNNFKKYVNTSQLIQYTHRRIREIKMKFDYDYL